jgi:DNA replication and repair protein RecF
MQLKTLKLQNFRNHQQSTLDLGSETNVLLGDNGQGKTNIIEAISYLCLTKSFFANSDAHVLAFGKDTFEVEGTFESERGTEYNVRIVYDHRLPQKVVNINRQRLDLFSSIVGKFPVVICSPEHTPITSGGPAERRKFVDFVVSQSSSAYFRDLIEYRGVLKQRNKILLDAKLSRSDPAILLEPWDEQLIGFGSLLIQRRQQFIKEFQEFVCSAYHHLVGAEEKPTIEYLPPFQVPENSGINDIQELLRSELNDKKKEERKTGSTLAGPHRDEIAFKINGSDLRKFASQGQHKTFLVALKVGEFFYLKERCRETPILLLDDVFSELDEHRAKQLLNFVGTLSQTFITSTNIHLLDSVVELMEKNKKFYIQNGSVVEQNTMAVA